MNRTERRAEAKKARSRRKQANYDARVQAAYMALITGETYVVLNKQVGPHEIQPAKKPYMPHQLIYYMTPQRADNMLSKIHRRQSRKKRNQSST